MEQFEGSGETGTPHSSGSEYSNLQTLLPRGYPGPASSGQDFLLSEEIMPLTGCTCPAAATFLLPVHAKTRKAFFPTGFLISRPPDSAGLLWAWLLRASGAKFPLA